MQSWMDLKMLVSAYDINCQYQINFLKRMRELANMVPRLVSVQRGWNMDIVHIAGVGKFHLPAHKASCREVHSMRLLPGVAQTDGEAQERVWSVLNPTSTWIKEMAAGHRHDTINEYHDATNEVRATTLRELCIMYRVVAYLTLATAEYLRKRHDLAKSKLRSVKDHVSTIEEDIECNEELGPRKLEQWRAEEKRWLARLVKRERLDDLKNPYASAAQSCEYSCTRLVCS